MKHRTIMFAPRLFLEVGKLCRVTACLLLGLAGAAQANLVYNGDFEPESPQNPPPGWTMWGPNAWKIPAHFTRDTNEAHRGKASLRIHHPKGTQGYIVSAPEQAIRPRVGMKYSVSFWTQAAREGQATFGVTAYQSIKPFVNAPSPGSFKIQVSRQWQEHRFEFQEGLDFFAERSQFLLLTFHATSNPNEETTVWVDDVVVEEKANPNAVRLVDEDTLPYEPVPHRLKPGESLDVTVDARRISRPATREVGGISFHRVAGWTQQPYNREGKYTLHPELEEAIRELHLPMTRFYGVGHERFSLEASLDKAAELCRRIGVPLERVALELEEQSANLKLAPSEWAHAARYSLEKGYGFRYWEVGNEVYSQLFNSSQPMGQAFAAPDDYVAHVQAVHVALKAVQPTAQVGISIAVENTKWGNYVLKRAAGSYDFVVPHFYVFPQVRQSSFEAIALSHNYKVLDRVSRLNALIKAYNPESRPFIYDTEWGLHGSGTKGERADDVPRNANLWGTMHRAVRMIYYAREGLLKGASSWQMLNSVRAPGFGVLSQQAPEKRFMLYWLYYYFNRHIGESVLEMEGTAPFYQPAKGEDPLFSVGNYAGPLTPALLTISADGKAIYAVLANGSFSKTIPCHIKFSNFAPATVSSVVLSRKEPDAPPLLERKEDAISELPADLTQTDARLQLPAHSVVFLTISGEKK